MSPSELSPGLLDLHSFDTELLPEVRAVESLDHKLGLKSCSLNDDLWILDADSVWITITVINTSNL